MTLEELKKDLCVSCQWYYPESSVCQIKKCSGRSEYDQYVKKRDRRRCDNFDRKPIEKVTPNKHQELRGMSPVMKGTMPPPVTVEPGTVEYWDGDGKKYTIQACPHCGGTARVWGACNVDNISIRYIECDVCGAKSGVCSKASDAIEHWNARTGR